MSAAELPRLRNEFSDQVPWGSLDGLRRFEIITADVPGPIVGISNAAASIHGLRASLLIRIGGGNLPAPPEVLLSRLAAAAPSQLDKSLETPAAYMRSVVAWLEAEARSGILSDTFSTATVMVAVSRSEVWTWLMSPHGLVEGQPPSMVFGGTDVRYPVLRRIGAMRESGYRSPGVDMADRASSVFTIGTPDGYERTRTRLDERGVVMALDRGALPFADWPPDGTSLRDLWRMDAAWKHGLRGHAIAIGDLTRADLDVPAGWSVREVPLASP